MRRLLSVLIAATLTLGPALAQTAPAGALEKRVRLDFREAKILEVIRLIAEISGVNIVATEKAGETKVTAYLQDVPVKDALDVIAKSSGLWYRYDAASGVYRVMTTEEFQRDIVVFRREDTRIMTLRNANVVSAANAISALFGTRVKLVAPVEEASGLGTGIGGLFGSAPGTTGGQPVSTVQQSSIGAAGGTGAAATGATPGETERKELTAGQIAQMLEKLSGREQGSRTDRETRLADAVVEPPPIFVTYNRLHNLLIMRSSDLEALADVGRLVTELDRPTRQVLLEMKVLEITLGDSFRSVFDFGLTGGSALSGPAVGQPPNPLVPDAAQGSRVTLGAGNFPLEGGTLVFQFISDRVLARIQLLATENKVKVLATPLLLASNNQSARLFIGEERVLTTNAVANVVTNNNQTVTTLSAETEKRNIGNTLIILPRINADRTVTLSIQQDASSVLPKSATIPVSANGAIQEFPIDTVNTSNLQVTVVAKDRLAVAVGGMIRERTADAESKVPVLGDVPLLGKLFKRRVTENVKTALVLLITPYILDSPEEGEQRSRERLGVLMNQPNPLNGALQPGPEPAPAAQPVTPPTARTPINSLMEERARPPQPDPAAPANGGKAVTGPAPPPTSVDLGVSDGGG